MSSHRSLIIGIVASSLLTALPATASQSLPAGAFVIASRGDDDGRSAGRSDDRRQSSGRSSRRQSDDRGYGYGYERRQRDPQAGDSGSGQPQRSQQEQRNERGDDRGGSSHRGNRGDRR